MLSGSLPGWMLTDGDTIDLSYNKFIYDSSWDSCQIRQTNLFDSFSRDNITKNAVSCLGNIRCPITFVNEKAIRPDGDSVEGCPQFLFLHKTFIQ